MRYKIINVILAVLFLLVLSSSLFAQYYGYDYLYSILGLLFDSWPDVDSVTNFDVGV